MKLSAVGILLAVAMLLLHFSPIATAGEAQSAYENPALEARVQRIASELRCLVCQNQTIADSHAGLAIDLRNQVREMLLQGKTDAEILDFMTQRYGDFVLYRPPVKSSTWFLWFGPFILAIGGIAILTLVLRRRNTMPADQFDPEPSDPVASDPRPEPIQQRAHD